MAAQQTDVANEACVVILGKTGNGKSSIGNRLLGEDKFIAKASMSSETEKCSAASRKSAAGLHPMLVVDTPGTIDTSSRRQAVQELSEAITLSPRGFDAFLLVVRADVRITEEETEALADLVLVFGEKLYKFSIVVFTHADAVKENREEFVQTQRKRNEIIDKLLKDVGERWVMMDATSSGEVHELQGKIHELRMKNNYQKYTNILFSAAFCKLMFHFRNQLEEQETKAKEREKIRVEEQQRLEDKLEQLQKEFHRHKEENRKSVYEEILQLCKFKKSTARSPNSSKP